MYCDEVYVSGAFLDGMLLLIHAEYFNCTLGVLPLQPGHEWVIISDSSK